MNPQDVYAKTEKGVEEIRTRQHRLPQKLRSLLIMIDGAKPAAILIRQAASLGDVPGFLAELAQQGFIAPRFARDSGPGGIPTARSDGAPAKAPLPPGEEEMRRVEKAVTFMSNSLRHYRGPFASSLIDKLEKSERLEDVRRHLDEYASAIAKAGGGKVAADLTQKLRQLLA